MQPRFLSVIRHADHRSRMDGSRFVPCLTPEGIFQAETFASRFGLACKMQKPDPARKVLVLTTDAGHAIATGDEVERILSNDGFEVAIKSLSIDVFKDPTSGKTDLRACGAKHQACEAVIVVGHHDFHKRDWPTIIAGLCGEDVVQVEFGPSVKLDRSLDKCEGVHMVRFGPSTWQGSSIAPPG